MPGSEIAPGAIHLQQYLSVDAQRELAGECLALSADLCIVNWYAAHSRMGLHQDKDESPASIEAGAPVVSVSIGDTARFLFGGVRRKDQFSSMKLV